MREFLGVASAARVRRRNPFQLSSVFSVATNSCTRGHGLVKLVSAAMRSTRREIFFFPWKDLASECPTARGKTSRPRNPGCEGSGPRKERTGGARRANQPVAVRRTERGHAAPDPCAFSAGSTGSRHRRADKPKAGGKLSKGMDEWLVESGPIRARSEGQTVRRRDEIGPLRR
ncbi:hypothetical protein BDY21DRAFT_365537 [Lineolata rhizophorae]|uniref:Uncharacterized protein n=1 Tax=Lineolata rhizophorae TaxID=578093 RepID=A0A6A6NUS5_9PEZI|nr:hypothetical protein BDY21DRAFT_365537 [Lineolata rhizophorae]